MWLLIPFGVLLVFGITRRAVAGNWRFALPAVAGAVVGWELGKFLFAHAPAFCWVPWAWAVVVGLMAGETGKRWVDRTLGGQ